MTGGIQFPMQGGVMYFQPHRAASSQEVPQAPEASDCLDISAPSMKDESSPALLPDKTLQAPKPENLIKIPLIHTNDIHSSKRGLPLLEKAVDRLKSENPDAILIDSGDAGNSADADDPDRFGRITAFFNREGYTVVCPGNHEYQWGKDIAINEFFKKLDATVVNANVLDPVTGAPLEGTVPYMIENIEGINVGFLGITTTKMATPQHPDIGKDLISLPELATLKSEVREMKEKGADVIVALMHKGINDIRDEGQELNDFEIQQSIEILAEMAVKVPDIDVIAAGHDHKTAGVAIQTGPWPHMTYIVEAGSHGSKVGKIDLYVDPSTKSVVNAEMKIYPTRRYLVSGASE